MAATQDDPCRPPLRVGLMCPGWPPDAIANGIVSYTRDMCDGLVQAGAEPHVITRSLVGPGDAHVHLARKPGLEHNWLRRRVSRLWLRMGGPRAYAKLDAKAVMRSVGSLAARGDIDVLECEESYGLAGRVALEGIIPVIVRLHGPWFLNGPACGAAQDRAFEARVAAEGRALPQVHGLTAPTLDVLTRVREHYGLELPHAVVIPNPVRPIDLGQQWTLDQADRNRILFIGRFDRHKGGDLVIRAFVELAASHPTAQLVFVGPDKGLVDDQGRRWSFETYLDAHVPPAVRPRIDWRGRLPHTQLDDLRRGAMVTVVASRYENFPYAALEAMALGCPMIATRVGGLAEIIEDGRNGLQFEPGDAARLARQMDIMLEHPQQAATLGAQAARDCAARYHPRTIAVQTLDYYHRAIERMRRDTRPDRGTDHR